MSSIDLSNLSEAVALIRSLEFSLNGVEVIWAISANAVVDRHVPRICRCDQLAAVHWRGGQQVGMLESHVEHEQRVVRHRGLL